MASGTAVAVTAAYSSTATAPVLGRRRDRYHQKWSCGRSWWWWWCGGVRLRLRQRQRQSLCWCLAPLVPASDQWGNWTFLLSTAALGIWSEKRTAVGKALSGALVSVLVGLACSSGLPRGAGVPACCRWPSRCCSSERTCAACSAQRGRCCCPSCSELRPLRLAPFLLVPMRSLGPDNWKIAAALMSRHIGGAVNYVAVAEALEVSPSVLAAGLAADNIICALYFTTIFAIAARIPAEKEEEHAAAAGDHGDHGDMVTVTKSAVAMAAALAICKAGKLASAALGVPGGSGSLPCITAIVVALATLFPSHLGGLAPAADPMAVILMQVFFAVVGANGSIGNVINTSPSIFAFASVQIAVHLLLTLAVGNLLGLHTKLLLVASNANVGGPTTATAKGWTSLVLPGILAGIFGIAIATFMGIAFGPLVLKHMAA